VPVYGSPIEKELVTPTGAALLTELADAWGPLPAMTLRAVGYGAGSRDLVIPNVVRILLGDSSADDPWLSETLTVLETHLDNDRGETIGHASQRLMAEGALDVISIPAQMKKDRPGQVLKVLARPEDADRLERIFPESAPHESRLAETGNAAVFEKPGDGGCAKTCDTAPMNPPHKLVAATADETKARGAGMTLRAGIANSPFGHCLIADAPRGICRLSFCDAGARESAMAEVRGIWPLAEVVWEPSHARALAGGIFESDQGMRIFVAGTGFQLRVWRALLGIPMGATIAYGKLAARVGNPRAARATGSAVGANPVSFLIPCHRVISGSGAIGHYHWGADRKRAMLEWESARAGGA
jgi:AraC family transcriptional regulator of adaptative response/methylated-DNA-[protein]-cysteine methyltransferase